MCRKVFLIFISIFLIQVSSVKGMYNTDVWLFTDSIHIFSPSQILLKFPTKFKTVDASYLNLGLSDNEYWMMFDIKNSEDTDLKKFISINSSFATKINLYSVKGLELTNLKGVNVLNSNVFNLKCPPSSKKQFLMHITNNGIPVAFSLRLLDSNMKQKSNINNAFLYGAFYGILLLISLLLVFYSLINNKKSLKLLTLYSFGILIYFSLSDGLLMKLFPRISIDIYYKIFLVLVPVVISLLHSLLKGYEEWRFKAIKNNRFLKTNYILVVVYSTLVFSNLISNSLLTIIQHILIIFMVLVIFYSTLLKKGGSRNIIFIRASLLFLIIGFALNILYQYGFINPYIGKNILKYAFILHVGSFLLGLFDKYLLLQKELSKFNNDLNTLVAQKTREISHQKEELSAQTEQIEIQKEELLAQSDKLKIQKEEFEKEKEELQQILATTNSLNVIYIFDTHGNLEWFNNSFSSRLGMTYDEYKVLDQKIDIVKISTYENIREVTQKLLSEKEAQTYESCIVNGNKKTWFQTTLTPLNKNGEITSIVAIDTDITKLKEYEQELKLQGEKYEQQRNIAEKRREEVELQQREITDSLNYAQRIQQAILPKQSNITRFFPENFIYFVPKDIVSGDFFWFHRIDNKFIYVVVDCTGHGVPGAFMSIIGTYILNNIIIQNKETRPAEILKQLNRKLKISLKNNTESQTNDGMDVALTVVDKEENKLYFSGALRPLFLFKKEQFIEQKGDKKPITSTISGNTMATFNQYEFDIEPGDRFYMFSDGIIDQFGGKNNKKFLTKRLKQVLFDAQMYDMAEQKRLFERAMNHWKEDRPQVDDMLLVGVEI